MVAGPYSRHLLALAAGVIGGFLPNKASNIHPLLMGTILGLFFVKVLFGDWDFGYQWTASDVGFVLLTGLEGATGALLAQKSLEQ